jgi:hypothetical protein
MEDQKRNEAREALERRLALRLPKDHPDYDPFYDATDEELAGLVPPARGGERVD